MLSTDRDFGHKSKILVVDDEEAARYGMRKALLSRDHIILEARDIATATRTIQLEKPHLILLDINLPDGSGLDLLKQLNDLADPPVVIMITAYGSLHVAIDAIKGGAYYYLSKPFEVEDLRKQVYNALENLSLRRENRRLKDQLIAQDKYGELIGHSPPMQSVFELIDKVAATEVTLLITGESGTGKDLVAREIHRRSARADAPFVAMNCAALPENLIESELFGHEKGAFTGAAAQRKGKFEAADTGTLFLDEIADMTPMTQAKVLRVIEQREFERLGGNKTLSVDVRLISATNKDLSAEIQKGLFREDLFYRLQVVSLPLPPLRQRTSDIPVLLNYYCEKFSTKHNMPLREFAADAVARLCQYGWPGNVRELRNFVERCVILSPSATIELQHLPKDLLSALSYSQFPAKSLLEEKLQYYKQMRYDDAKSAFEREYLTAILEDHAGNLSRAAEAMGIHRQTLQYKLKQLGIKRKWTE
ncbi:MAG: sigma-54-dependent Fis family transcriptional regulator [Acidobacteria bacterium]|nr:sigma-54-dependent Fis family transcriptional regulator [Acidobacteriota bacterium]MBI3658324.1 sigma-54-dependent Fis family transcriptional regulator [Acidobacteriota bacterium]